MAPWRPTGFELTPTALYKVSASDIDNELICPQHAYIKTRRGARIIGTHRWSKTYDPEPILLGQFLSILTIYHKSRARGATHEEAQATALESIKNAHVGQQSYLGRALDNYLDYFEAREEQLGYPLHYLGFDHEIRVTRSGALSFWAPAYYTDTGHIEVHRLHIKQAKPDGTKWAVLAAYVASRLVKNPRTVTVTSVSLHYSSRNRGEAIVLDSVSVAEIHELYETSARPRALELIEGGSPRPGRDCASCKAVGVCDALIPMDGALQQLEPAPYTRSVSATDLRIYERCPARWYMERKLDLPAAEEAIGYGEDVDRGRAVHKWLRIAHLRRIPCTEADLPDVEARDAKHVAYDALDDAEYAAALPFLRQHLKHCPLSKNARLILADEVLYGWDVTADTIVIFKPDAIYAYNNQLIVRETKTTSLDFPKDADSARDSFDEVVYWLLSLLSRGLCSRFGAEVGVVELEILGPTDSALYSYTTTDSTTMLIAETRVFHRVEGWHYDTEWLTRPSAHCETCPMRIWCPDRERYLDSSSPTTAGLDATKEAPYR